MLIKGDRCESQAFWQNEWCCLCKPNLTVRPYWQKKTDMIVATVNTAGWQQRCHWPPTVAIWIQWMHIGVAIDIIGFAKFTIIGVSIPDHPMFPKNVKLGTCTKQPILKRKKKLGLTFQSTWLFEEKKTAGGDKWSPVVVVVVVVIGIQWMHFWHFNFLASQHTIIKVSHSCPTQKWFL